MDFKTEFGILEKIFDEVLYTEATPENLRELAKQAEKLAKMLEA